MIKDHTIRYKQNRDLLSGSNSKSRQETGGGCVNYLSTVTSPPVVWKRLDGYQLKNLKKEFKIAEFERNASAAHIKDILKAILENRFYDNVIRVVKSKAGPYGVIDAQHRLQALWMAYEKHGVKTYNLILAIYPEEFARIIYRRLNMGKRLIQRDHSKALDDKRVPFFNELREWLYHERTPAKNSYVEALNALWYYRGYNKVVQIKELDTAIESVTRKDIDIMKEFCQATKLHSPNTYGSLIYKAIVYRNVFKVGYERNYKKNDFSKLLEEVAVNKKILALQKQRTHAEILLAYKVIVDEILPRIEKR